jgi:UDP-GlcNAc3NAcA epimerase
LFSSIGVSSGGYLLVTVHRAENTDDAARLRVIVAALSVLAQTSPVVWPMHPRTRSALHKTGLFDLLTSSKVRVIDPVGYLDMVKLETGASVIVTDSGGVQKEAYFFKVPCVTLRDETEWVELVETGWNRLTPPTDVDRIVETVLASHGAQGRDIELYGNGDAARKIVAKLATDLG